MSDERVTRADVRQEPEVLAAMLKEMGCPYPAASDEAGIWVDGYRAGVTEGGRICAKALRDELGG